MRESQFGGLLWPVRILTAGWLMVGFLLPKTPLAHFGARALLEFWLKQQSLALELGCCTLLFLAAWLSFARIARRDLRTEALWWLLLVLAIPYMLFAFGAPKGVVYEAGSSLLLVMACGLAAARLAGSPARAAGLLVVLGTAQALCALWLFAGDPTAWVSHHMPRVAGTYHQPAHLASVLMLSFLPACALIAHDRRHWARRLWSACALLIGLALLGTLSRGFIWGTSIALVWLVSRQVQRRSARLLVAAVLAACCLLAATLRSQDRPGRTGIDVAYRADLWRQGLAEFGRHPILGKGVCSLEFKVREVTGPGDWADAIYGDCENLVLNFLAERGLVGGVLLAAMGIAIFLLARRAHEGAVVQGLAVAFLAMLIAGMWDIVAFAYGRHNETAVTLFLLGALLLSQRSPALEVPA